MHQSLLSCPGGSRSQIPGLHLLFVLFGLLSVMPKTSQPVRDLLSFKLKDDKDARDCQKKKRPTWNNTVFRFENHHVTVIVVS